MTKGVIMIKLGVNVDHVATLRQMRGGRYPDPVAAAALAERAGADGITVHLREDRRHIQERDVELLLQTVTTKVNLEMAATEPMMVLAARYRPTDCCLVPERREELTTEGGLEVAGQRERLRDVVCFLHDAGLRVSLFIDPDPVQVEAAAAVGVRVVELHTGRFAEATTESARDLALADLARANGLASELGLTVNAGHGLHYHSVQEVAALPGLNELNIGHAIVARAVMDGMIVAVSEMKRLMRESVLFSRAVPGR